MNGIEISKRFLEYSKTVQAGAAPEARPGDVLATLYGLDEVLINAAAGTTTFPDHGTVPSPGVEPVKGAEWYALVPVPGQGMKFVIGSGDPYGPNQVELPQRNGIVMAVPHTTINGFQNATNREQRRGMKKN